MAVPVKGPVGGANETLAVYAINSFIVLFQDSDQLTLDMKKKIQQQQQQYTASFSFLSFFFPLVTAVGNTIREESPHVTESNPSLGFWIPRPKFRIPGTGFQTVSEIWILDSNL